MRNEEPFFQCPEYNSEHFFIRKMNGQNLEYEIVFAADMKIF